MISWGQDKNLIQIIYKLDNQQHGWMGNRNSVQVQSPPFHQNQWQYLPDREDMHEDYGYFRTLQHILTGQKIDQYEFIWEDEEEFDYYLKSYNWRYRQENVVNTKFIDVQSKTEFCSRTQMARVYLQHIQIRMSEIYDIPCPDNLYLILQALEGYSKIYQHSRFFEIEENQICVDEAGKVNIWVNGDLSINYPSSQGADEQNKGEQEMVDKLIRIVAENTDADSQPETTFMNYYLKKKGTNGKTFEQAKILVQSYIRINNISLPTFFEAVFNVNNQQTLQLKSFTGNSNVFSAGSRRSSIHQRISRKPSTEFYEHLPAHPPQIFRSAASNFHQQMSFGRQMMAQPHYSMVVNPQKMTHNVFIRTTPVAQHNSIVQNYYARPAMPMPPITVQAYPVNPNAIPINSQPVPPFTYQVVQQQSKHQVVPNAEVGNHPIPSSAAEQWSTQNPNNNLSSSLKKKATIVSEKKKVRLVSDSEQDRDKVIVQLQEFQGRHRRLIKTQKQQSKIQSRDMIAKSLPLDFALKKKNSQELNKMVPIEKAVQSHIRSNQQQFNSLKLNQLKSAKKSESGSKQKQGRHQKLSLKYYTTLQNELQMDPQIAADLAKYGLGI